MKRFRELLSRRVTTILNRIQHRRLPLFWAVALTGSLGPWLLTGQPGTATRQVDTLPTCAVDHIHDGDTVTLWCQGRKTRVRLWCIDAPELGQTPWGRRSRDHLRALTGRRVRLRRIDTDRYGRTIGELFTPDGQDLNRAMVRDGWAAVYNRYCPARRYRQAERAARRQKLGIWSRRGLQQRPWRWRHR